MWRLPKGKTGGEVNHDEWYHQDQDQKAGRERNFGPKAPLRRQQQRQHDRANYDEEGEQVNYHVTTVLHDAIGVAVPNSAQRSWRKSRGVQPINIYVLGARLGLRGVSILGTDRALAQHDWAQG